MSHDETDTERLPHSVPAHLTEAQYRTEMLRLLRDQGKTLKEIERRLHDGDLRMHGHGADLATIKADIAEIKEQRDEHAEAIAAIDRRLAVAETAVTIAKWVAGIIGGVILASATGGILWSMAKAAG